MTNFLTRKNLSPFTVVFLPKSRKLIFTVALMDPFCDQILASLGSEVLKVKNPPEDTNRELTGVGEPSMSFCKSESSQTLYCS